MSTVHHVGRLDWSFADTPDHRLADVVGAVPRRSSSGRAQGAAHTELAAGCPGTRRLARPAHPLVRGGAVRPRGRADLRDRPPRPPTRRRRLRADPDRDAPHAGGDRDGRRSAGCPCRTPPRRPPDAPVPDTIFAKGRPNVEALTRGRRAARAPGPDAPLRRPLRGHAAAGWRRCAVTDPARGREPAGHGHRDPRLQRHLREDARRQAVRRRPHDDVHGRLRGRRRGAGARPPVRGGLRVPRGRGPGRARRRGVHVPARGRRVLGRRQRPRLLERRARPGPLARDPGAPAAGPQLVPLAAVMGRDRRARHRGLARRDTRRT